MTKYDFGYDIVPNSVMEWAFNCISNRTVILELGPAIGTLTKHLKEDKECQIDIVEIDTKSGNQAEKYARTSCIGEIEGDLEKDEWKAIIGNERQYDYIVILDVLEHLRNPECILKHVKNLLKEDGEILLSVPNIAHNSVLIDLFNNKFQYTKVGLLDDTHVRFFTYKSLDTMLDSVGLYAYLKEYKQLLVSENEITNSYNDIPEDMENCLRTREYADVYQFTYRVRGKNENEILRQNIPNSLPYTLYPLEIFAEDILVDSFHIDPRNVNVTFVYKKMTEKIRIDPINKACVINDLRIVYLGDDFVEEASIVNTNGIEFSRNQLIFLDNDPQVYILNKGGAVKININFQCTLISQHYLDFFQKLVVKNIELEAGFEEVQENLQEKQRKL